MNANWKIAAAVGALIVLTPAVVIRLRQHSEDAPARPRVVAPLVDPPGYESYEAVETHVAPYEPPDVLADDMLKNKHPVFEPELAQSRPLGPTNNPWQINASAAVIRLDVPDIRSDAPDAMQRLYPDYASAAKALKENYVNVLPSVNLLGGKAKQFDDGLYAAMDLYMTSNEEQGVRNVAVCVRQLLAEFSSEDDAYAWLWAALEIGGFLSEEENQRRPAGADSYIADFLADKRQSQPVGFYTWNKDLRRTFRFLRYLQQKFPEREGVADSLAQVLARNGQTRAQYERMLAFYSSLTNPFINLSLLPLADPVHEGQDLAAIAESTGVRKANVAFLPSSDAPETELFERLYPTGMPADANLMMDLVQAIRDGSVDLEPTSHSGWYDYQLHALEALLLPGAGPESDKLLLTKRYKLRLVEAFKALVTKTRETHIRQLHVSEGFSDMGPPEEGVAPRLRLEPNPTYYLRIARSYAFLQNYLTAIVPNLAELHGRSADGPRDLALDEELANMRQLFYGLYFVSCDDIGLKPELLDGENAPLVACRTAAENWLANWESDPDLAVDTRVAVPIYRMPSNPLLGTEGYTRFWLSVGVRPIRLTAEYVVDPSWRPMPRPNETPRKWERLPPYQTEQASWVILGDDFIEAQLGPNATLTRKQLREVCDQHPSKNEIAAALRAREELGN